MDSRELLGWLANHNYEIRIAGSGHYKIYVGQRAIVTIAATSGGGRGVRNAIATLRRAGVPIPRKEDK